MRTEVKARVLTKTTELLARLEGARSSVLAAAEDVAVAEGSRNPGAWLAHHTHLTSNTGQSLWKLARTLDAQPDVTEALATGRIHVEQARDLLLTQAVDLDARALRQLSKRVLSIVAPEVADANDAAWLAKQEALAHRDASLSLFDDG